MNGEMNIKVLLGSMGPMLCITEFVFCAVQKESDLPDLVNIWALIREEEALTMVIERETAEKLKFSYNSVFRRITLNIHSSLDAVGLTAAVSAKLAEHDISANVIAAFYHDHIFVQKEKAERALSCLRELVKENL